MRRPRRATEQKRAIQEVLVQMFGIMLCAGIDEDDVRAHANICVDKAKKQSKVPPFLSQDIDAQEIGSVIRTWHRQDKYLSREGYPRPLRLQGSNGLRKLIGLYFPEEHIDQIFTTMRSAGLIRMTERNSWIPTRHQAVIPQLTSEMLRHLSEGVSRFVDTVIGNVTAERDEEILFERSAKVSKFPAKAAAEFRGFVRSQAVSFLSAIDDWMEAKAEAERKKKGRKCTVGVFTFGFMDNAARHGAKANRR